MTICDFQTSLGQLKEASQKLRERWEAVREEWQDASAARFEEEHLRPIEPILAWTVSAVNQMNDLMQHAEQDLS